MKKERFTIDAWLQDMSRKVVDEDGDSVDPRVCSLGWLLEKQDRLFLITPEPELSEFEEAVGAEIFDPPFNGEQIKVIKEESAKLLELARKEINRDLPIWKKCAPCDEDKSPIPAWIVRFDAESAGESAVVHNGHYILFGDLEKLPKEDEKWQPQKQ